MKHFGSLIFVAAIFCPTVTFGQPALGVRWGVNVTTLEIQGAPQYASTGHINIKVGAGVNLPVQNRFSLQFYGDYVKKGAEYFTLDEFMVTIDYIEFSGMANISLVSPRRRPSLFVIAGPTVAVKVRSTGEVALARRGRIDSFAFKTLDVGVAGGIGTQVAFKAMTLKAELLYNRSIRAINEIADLGNMINHAVSLSLGFGFPI